VQGIGGHDAAEPLQGLYAERSDIVHKLFGDAAGGLSRDYRVAPELGAGCCRSRWVPDRM
jgi:hypothetical protein